MSARIATLYLPIPLDKIVVLMREFDRQFPGCVLQADPDDDKVMHIAAPETGS